MVWGDAHCGGCSDAVQGRLRTAQQVQASGSAFAAILGDVSVVTWGAAVSGGDCYAMQQLKKCSRFKPLTVLLLGDGSVVTCGAADGGDCSAVQGKPVSSSSLTAKNRK